MHTGDHATPVATRGSTQRDMFWFSAITFGPEPNHGPRQRMEKPSPCISPDPSQPAAAPWQRIGGGVLTCPCACVGMLAARVHSLGTPLSSHRAEHVPARAGTTHWCAVACEQLRVGHGGTSRWIQAVGVICKLTTDLGGEQADVLVRLA